MTRLIRFYGAVSRVRANKTHIYLFSHGFLVRRSQRHRVASLFAIRLFIVVVGRACKYCQTRARVSIRKIFLIANLCSHKERHSWFAFISTFCPSAFAFRICTHTRDLYIPFYFFHCWLLVFVCKTCARCTYIYIRFVVSRSEPIFIIITIFVLFALKFETCFPLDMETRTRSDARRGGGARCEWGSKCV